MSNDILKRFEIELPLTELKKDLVSQDDEPILFKRRYDLLLENLNKMILSLKNASKVQPEFLTSLHKAAEDFTDRHGQWVRLTSDIAVLIAKWWEPDMTGDEQLDWVDWFRPLSHAFVDVLESRPNYFLQEARQDFEQFYITYLRMCLRHKREEIIPEILSVIRGQEPKSLKNKTGKIHFDVSL